MMKTTMMSSETPWDDIGSPKADFNVRKVAGTDATPIFWGKNVQGNCLLIIELDGDHSTQFRNDVITLHGITVDLRNGEVPFKQRLILTLEKHVDRDLFFGLCKTLIASLVPVSDASVALSVVLIHIKRWKAFLAGRKLRLLSAEEIQGLFAELQFLRLLYTRRLSEIAALDAWCGIDSVHQDFIFGDTAVEIKSVSGRERNSVRISSEDQLESLSSNLFLMIYKLSDMPDSHHANSLNDIIRIIELELTGDKALEAFSEKLSSFGYIPLPEYDTPRFVVSNSQCYQVLEGFPKLVRSRLPQGIARLSYEIKLESIKAYMCSDSLVLERS